MQSHTLCITLVSPAEKNLRIITPPQNLLSDIFILSQAIRPAGSAERKK
jgi:hypothetical protein